ncbi:MAG TPA: leucine--tRNA ligase [Candidatus Dormibacteraeota bacterium]|jgi:leucyl-tRNA synthetase|nr:leucine--tRNA ligase [Candidatus Dormibacteraeota bacterium]
MEIEQVQDTGEQPQRIGAYDHTAVEAKWRQRWAEEQTYKADLDTPARPYYNLMMFPYPSAEGLHTGHAFTFSGADAHGRFRRMQGNDVFQPMGWDAFGIHSENYALKVGEHPTRLMPRTVANFKRQMDRLGAGFDWSHELNTSAPDYYRWTQWIFVQLMKRGLAEQKEAAVNWCPRDLTVLADEQVIAGRCERCGAVVERRVLKQWFLKITDYAQQLLDGLDTLDWSDVVVSAQRNWIGRSEGAMIRFDLEGCARGDVTVFTTRPDTLCGATFLVVGADHPKLDEFTAPERREAVARWRAELPADQDEPDFSIGIDLGSQGVHPLTGARVPVFAAPYVLGGYGTGAIMAVPGHDERDWQFARAHSLPIVEVITGGDVDDEAYTGSGVLVNSVEFDGLSSDEAKQHIVARLQEQGRGESAVQFRLRDWLISRQRYWGPPIPVIHCAQCGPVPVPEDQLPVLLPDVEDFKPIGTGLSPLASVEEWVNVPCPQCGGPGRRETDVSDTFLDSAWYFLRYPSTEFDGVPFDRERTWRWAPVTIYIGGKEHSVLHLLYARFINRVLYDAGFVPAQEPFPLFRANGLIIKDGAKMSKSRGNVVSPDVYMDTYGADTLRVYLLFLGPYEQGGDFRDEGISGAVRFLSRVWRIATADTLTDAADDRRERRRHALVKAITERMGGLRFNTAIALLMTYVDELTGDAAAGGVRRVDVETLLQLLAPLAPHITEELWERTGHTGSIHRSQWPGYDPSLAAAQEVTIAVQINGKVRDTLHVPVGMSPSELEGLAKRLPRIQELLAEKPIRKAIVVPERIVNFVV